MPLPLYLAMTAAEISGANQLPDPLAYMACHYSAYSAGLSNLPEQLPKGSMLIFNDRIPAAGHDPGRIVGQLKELCAALETECLLLDLQRPGDETTERIVRQLLAEPVCPVGVSELYAVDLDCPVFVSAPPLHVTLQQHLAAWSNREIWLETATDYCCYTVTETDSRISAACHEAPLPCPQLRCHYGIYDHSDRIDFAIKRTAEDLKGLLMDAEAMGITKAIGLYQQLQM